MTTVIDRSASTAPGSGGAIEPKRLPPPKTISVNGTVIPRTAIAQETQNHPAAKPIDAWLAAARALVIRELLLQQARTLALDPAPLTDEEGRRETDEEALIRQVVEREVTTPEVDEATCRRIYDRERAEFRSSPLYAVRHILLAAPPADQARRREARQQAEALLAAIVADPSLFAACAEAHSACPSRSQGGNLGQISRGQTVSEFEEALETIGDLGLVETRFGFHIVAVDQRIAGRDLPYEVAAPRIAAWLADRAEHAAIQQYIGMLAGRAAITGIDLAVPAAASR